MITRRCVEREARVRILNRMWPRVATYNRPWDISCPLISLRWGEEFQKLGVEKGVLLQALAEAQRE